MEGKRLLERIREMARDPKDRKPADAETLQQSVLSHLTKILNTRQGSTVIAGDYGVPDFSALTTAPNADNLARIEEDIREVVQRYEPRLRRVDVRFAADPDDPHKMSFTLSGELVGAAEETPVAFQTVLAPTGRISIRRRQIE